MASIRIAPHEPSSTITLEVGGDDGASARIVLSATDVAELIGSLSEARITLVDEVPRKLDPGNRIASLIDPVWSMPRAHPEGYRALGVRHPGFGWLSFAFPQPGAEEIARRWLDPEAPTTPVDFVDAPNPFRSPPDLEVEFTAHAQFVLEQRGIQRAWVDRTLHSPDAREPDPSDPALVRYFKAIPERDGRVLRLVFRPVANGYKIITVFFDRSRPR